MTIASAITAKLLTIAPAANAIIVQATLADIRQSSYWSADISLARLAAVYNGAAGLVSREATELLLNQLEDADIQAYIAERSANPAPAEALEEEQASEDLVNLELDSEACAGCGAMPGDGYTAGCDHPAGCGYLRELEEQARALEALPCYLCVAPEHRMEELPEHRWPVRKIVRRFTAGRADPTESYTLECGHTII
jgi:hypothetical protein